MTILIALTVFVLAVLLHGLVMRFAMQVDSVRRFLMVGIPLGLALAAFSLARFGLALNGFATILLYALLCELYMFCFTLVISSVSVTMLIKLRQGPVADSSLVSVNALDEMVQLRVSRLIKTGFVTQNGGRLAVTAKGTKLHLIFKGLRHFFYHDPA